MKAVFMSPAQGSLGFESIMWLRSQEMIRALQQLGVKVLPIINTGSEASRNTFRAVKDFNPNFITSANFNYFLEPTLSERDLFNLLERPIIAIWDDPLGALARHLDGIMRSAGGSGGRALLRTIKKAFIGPTGTLKESLHPVTHRSDALEIFRKVMRHPLIQHFSWDTGHMEAVNLLELTEPKRVRWYPLVTYSRFLKTGMRATAVPQTTEIAFCGNVYLDLVKRNGFWEDEFFRSLTNEICDRRLKELDRSVWNLMIEEIGKLSLTTRTKYGLYWDRKPFWDYYVFVAWHAANTFVRLGILSKVKRNVNIYGLFADPQSRELIRDYPNLNFQGDVHHFEGLPGIYASSKINICVSNGLIYKGIPSKLIDCLASGGFALTDPKKDLVGLFGQSIERIFFRDVDELNEKIEYFLSHPAEREEIVCELRGQVQQHCTLKKLFEQVLASVEG